MSFFGDRANNQEIKKNILEEIFSLSYAAHIGVTECYNLPVSYRKFFYQRLIKQKKSEK